LSASETFEASVFRLIFFLFAGILIFLGVTSWFLRETAEGADTFTYWLIAGREPYIEDDDKRREHFEF